MNFTVVDLYLPRFSVRQGQPNLLKMDSLKFLAVTLKFKYSQEVLVYFELEVEFETPFFLDLLLFIAEENVKCQIFSSE